MRIATHPEAIKHLVKIGMASDISEHIKMVESANESLIKEKDELRSVAEDNKRECEATRIDNARLKAEVERLAMAGNQSIAIGVKLREMLGDHHWSMEFDRVRTDWYHASRGVLSRTQNPNTPPTAV